MAYKENPREAKQISIHEGLLIQPDKDTGRGSEWLPDAYMGDERFELKTGQRKKLKDGSRGSGIISTTRSWKLGCVDNGAYSPDVHWIISFYEEEGDGFTFYEHWYCAPGWTTDWQNRQKNKLLMTYKDAIDLFDEAIALGLRTEEQVSQIKDKLFKNLDLNDPRISLTYIQESPLCVQYDGTKNGLLEAMEKVHSGKNTTNKPISREKVNLQDKHNGRPPYGYEIGEKGSLVELDQEQKVIDMIKDLRDKPYGPYLDRKTPYHVIAEKLNDKGILKRDETEWKKWDVRYLLEIKKPF